MTDAAEKHLPRIEALLVLLLQKLGATTEEIGNVMELSPSTIRNKYRKVSAAEVQMADDE